MTDFRRLKIRNLTLRMFATQAQRTLKFKVVSAQFRPASASAYQEAQPVLRGKTLIILAFYDQWPVSRCWAGTARQLQVRHFTFPWNCESSAAQQCKRAILNPFVNSLTGSLLQRSNNLICTPITSLVQVRNNHSWQILSINENRPQNIFLARATNKICKHSQKCVSS